MATDQQIEELFDSVRGRIADITSRTRKYSGRGNVGCALMVLPILGVIGLLVASQDVSPVSPSRFWWFWLGVLVAVVVCFRIGWKLWLPWSRSNSALQDETDDALIRPLVEALVPGGTFSRPTITTSGFHSSLLLPRQEKGSVRVAKQSRVEGRIGEMPVVIDEIEGAFDANVDEGWIARVELPFAIDGHLRIWVPRGFWKGWAEWTDGFEKMTDATARLGAPYTVDVAPIGTGPETASATASPGAHPPDVVCANSLFDALRARPDVRMAVADRTLWIVLPRPLRVFASHIASPDDLATWKKAAVAMRDIETIAREVLAAPGARG
jgi:hypothetical protein